MTHWGMSTHQRGPMAAPGRYSVRLSVDGRTYSAPLEILLDPHAPAKAADLKAQTDIQLRIAGDVDRVARKINLLEQMRHQIEELRARTTDMAQLAAYADIDGKLHAVENEMFSKDLAPSDDKYYISAYKVYFNLLWLNAEIGQGAGDVAGGAEHGPTAAQPKELAWIEGQLATAEGHFATLMSGEVAAFNQAQAGRRLPALRTTLDGSSDAEKRTRAQENKEADEDYSDD